VEEGLSIEDFIRSSALVFWRNQRAQKMAKEILSCNGARKGRKERKLKRRRQKRTEEAPRLLDEEAVFPQHTSKASLMGLPNELIGRTSGVSSEPVGH